ncbi:S41 family peptidase [Corynebacterium sp. TA-R-1]|uniref:S41 family peptidase n=1 Tax=Corynebacterium stercoris TaxID=2943490 RepID=A0ABT1G203_9CORY|nr:S41 family peptidase [Corynebacterium stercoris]MCP1386747.1 S41 family peptidase [Corynebacterium stercoris]
MGNARKLRRALGAVALVLLVLAGAGLYVYGPVLSAKLTGQARFLGTDTPKRYTETVLQLTDLGVYAGSPEYVEAREAALDAARTASSREELYPLLDAAVAAAGGKHSALLRAGDETAGSEGTDSTRFAGVEMDGNVAFAAVPEISRHEDGQRYADTLGEGLTRARDGGACGAIVDLRGNTGGNMYPMLAGVSPLLPDGPAFFFQFQAGEMPIEIDGNSVTPAGTALSQPVGKWEVPLAVLVDDHTASSGEAVMLAFRGLDRSRSFGSPTAGYASSNSVFDFPDGSALLITQAWDKARTGEVFGEDPVPPDTDVRLSGTVPAAKDWLRAEYGCS